MAFTNWNDGVSFSGLSATPSSFYVLGGRYALVVNATWGGGNVVLKQLMPDGTTYIAVDPTFTADNSVIIDLPPGTYQLTITTATAVQGSLVRVPYRAA